MKSSRIFDVGEVSSTNTHMANHKNEFVHGDVAFTDNQTAGRGQRGNSWEAEPGKNLTFSFMTRDLKVPVAKQFCISEAVAIAVAEVLSQYTDGIKIKWPNDIYYHDRKICGILIENTVSGYSITHSIAGIGININQREFLSPAPNPVSLLQITGKEYDLPTLLSLFADKLRELVDPFTQHNYETYAKKIEVKYATMLYRADGQLHPFQLPDGTCVMASIQGVASDGLMTLRYADGSDHKFYFKEVSFVI